MILNINSITDLSSFYVIYETSIKNETYGIRGLSHFVEHLMCKGFNDILNDFEKNGINWNAYTSDFRIVFYLNGLDEYLKDYRNIFLEKLLTFNINEKDVENEKKIIMEEYSDTFNKQSNAHFLNLYRKLFNNYNPIGEKNDILNFNSKICTDYWNKYYYTPTKIVNVSKNSKFESDIKFNNYNNDYNINYINNNDFIYESSNIYKSKTSIIYLSPMIDDDFPYINFAATLLGNGLKSPLYQEIREKNGLIYYINCYLDNLTNNNSVIQISTETSDDKINLLNDTLFDILKNKEKFITKDRFEIIKRSYEIHYKKNEINRYSNINKYINPDKWLIEPFLKDMTLDRIYYIYDKYFNLDNFYISYDKNEFRNK